MSGDNDKGVPFPWRNLIVSAWSPDGRRFSTLGSVYRVITGGGGSEHDRFIVRKLFEDADHDLLISMIRRGEMGYRTLADVAEACGAVAGLNVATMRDRASRHRKPELAQAEQSVRSTMKSWPTALSR
jgi:hypothetical protein